MDQLRESVARFLADEDAAASGREPYADASWAGVRSRWLVKADRLLAGPLALLLARLDAVVELEEKLERNVGLMRLQDKSGSLDVVLRSQSFADAAEWIRRALDAS